MAKGQFLLWRDRQGEEWGTPKTSECLRGDRSLPRGASVYGQGAQAREATPPAPQPPAARWWQPPHLGPTWGTRHTT